MADLFGVNRSFRTFAPHPEIPEGLPENGAKTTPGRQRGNPRTVGSDSIEARENIHFQGKSKGDKSPVPNRLKLAPPEREALSRGGPAPCQSQSSMKAVGGVKFPSPAPCLAPAPLPPKKGGRL